MIITPLLIYGEVRETDFQIKVVLPHKILVSLVRMIFIMTVKTE